MAWKTNKQETFCSKEYAELWHQPYRAVLYCMTHTQCWGLGMTLVASSLEPTISVLFWVVSSCEKDVCNSFLQASTSFHYIYSDAKTFEVELHHTEKTLCTRIVQCLYQVSLAKRALKESNWEWKEFKNMLLSLKNMTFFNHP